jgi:aminoacrylate hydrolase
MPLLTANGIQHHYELTSGTGGDTTIALVAGMGGTASFWAPQLQALAGLGPVLTYDQRGTGLTEHVPVASIEQLADDFVALLDALSIESVHLVGHSTGGAIGLSVAARHPGRLRSLLLYASVHRADEYRKRVWGHRKCVLEHMGPLAYAQTTSLFFYPPDYIAANSEMLREAEQRAAERELSAPEIMSSRIEAILAFDVAHALPGFVTPTKVICARDDLLTPLYFSREIATLIPGAQLQVVDWGGHAFSRSRPEVFNAALAEFIQSHTTTPEAH